MGFVPEWILRISGRGLGFKMRQKLEEEVARYHKFQGLVKNDTTGADIPVQKIDVRAYAKYLLKEGAITEKRELLANLRSRLMYKDKRLYLVADAI